MADIQMEKNQKEAAFLLSWRPYLWIALTCFLLYAQTLNFGLTYFDDDIFVKSNYAFNKDITNLFEVFKTSVFITHPSEYYRPLLDVSFILNAVLGASGPAGYHLFNILFHILAACLFFRLLMALGYSKGISFFCGLIYSVHPVLTQAVAWIPGRNDSLLAIFVFSSLIQFIRFQSSQRWQNAFWHLLFFIAALFTKESGVGLLIVCAAYVLLSGQKISRRKLMGIGLGWLFALGLWLMLRSQAIEKDYQVTISQMASSIYDNLGALLQYFGKMLFPFNLSVFPIKEDTTYIYGVLALLLTGGLVLFSKNKRPRPMIFGTVFFAVFLVPGLMVSKLSLASPLMEQRLLLPLAGFTMVFLETDIARHFDINKEPGRFWAIILLVVLSALTFVHSGNFKDNISFWQDVVRTSPHSSLAHGMLGEIYRKKGQLSEAETEYIKCLEIKPDDLMTTVDLAVLYMQENRMEDSEKLFNKALTLNIKSEQVREFITKNLDQVRLMRGKNTGKKVQ